MLLHRRADRGGTCTFCGDAVPLTYKDRQQAAEAAAAKAEAAEAAEAGGADADAATIAARAFKVSTCPPQLTKLPKLHQQFLIPKCARTRTSSRLHLSSLQTSKPFTTNQSFQPPNQLTQPAQPT
mgnify:CR=1 FL=1